MIRKYVFCLASVAVGCIALMLASCSSDANMYDYVSSDDAVVVQCDLTKIIDNTGSKITADGVELSPSLQKLSTHMLSGRHRQHFDDLLSVKGIDLRNIVVAVNEQMEATVTFKVTSKGKFKEYLQKVTYDDVQESEEKGYTIYRIDNERTVFLAGSIACMLVADRNVDASDMETLKKQAKSDPLSSWQKKALRQGSTFNMLMNLSKYMRLIESNVGYGFSLVGLKAGYDEAQLEHAFAKANFTLDGLELTGTIAMVDDNDKPLESKYAGLKMDTSLLKYASANDIFVEMTAVPGTVNWPEILDGMIVEMDGYRQYGIDHETVNAIGDVLSDIDGTVMLAAGPKNILKANTTDGWSAVLAAQMKPGMADKYMTQVKNLIEATNASMADLAGEYAAIGYRGYKPKTVTCTDTADGMKIELPEAGTVYLKVIDDALVASLAPVTASSDCQIAADEFEGKSCGMVLHMPRNNALSGIVQLPFGIDVKYVSDSHTAHFTAKETDAEGRMLENIFKLIAGQSR